MKKKNLLLFIVLFILALPVSFMINKNKGTNSATNLPKVNLGPFVETINAPESYRITDYDYWTEDKAPTQLGQTASSDISIFIKDSETVNNIHNIINSKDFTSITREEFYHHYNNINHDTKLWLYSWIDSDLADEYFHAYQIFISKKFDIYILTSKGNDRRYIKSTITEDEFDYIQQSYNNLMKKEVE